MEEFECGKVNFCLQNIQHQKKDVFVLGTINGPWKCESNVNLQADALEKAKADASQSTESVNN